jgi:hypothetical protein
MKKRFVSLIVMMTLLLNYSQSTFAQRVYVDNKPHASIVVKTHPPSVHHVWVSDEWTLRSGKYENVAQHWETPPPKHKHWNSGKWKNEKGHGNYWSPGHWN